MEERGYERGYGAVRDGFATVIRPYEAAGIFNKSYWCTIRLIKEGFSRVHYPHPTTGGGGVSIRIYRMISL